MKKLLENNKFILQLSNKFGQQYIQFLFGLKNSNNNSVFENIDVKTYWRIKRQLLALDNCTHRISIPLKHAYIKNYGLINHSTQKQHMMITYKNYRSYEIKISDEFNGNSKKQASLLLPKGLKRVLSSAKA